MTDTKTQADEIKRMAEKMEVSYGCRDIPTGDLYRGIALRHWQEDRAALHSAIDALQARCERAEAALPKPLPVETVSAIWLSFRLLPNISCADFLQHVRTIEKALGVTP